MILHHIGRTRPVRNVGHNSFNRQVTTTNLISYLTTGIGIHATTVEYVNREVTYPRERATYLLPHRPSLEVTHCWRFQAYDGYTSVKT